MPPIGDGSAASGPGVALAHLRSTEPTMTAVPPRRSMLSTDFIVHEPPASAPVPERWAGCKRASRTRLYTSAHGWARPGPSHSNEGSVDWRELCRDVDIIPLRK